MTYWRLFYHVIWTTKRREPLVSLDVAGPLHSVIGAKATEMGALVHGVGGTADHVHLVASVPPTMALSEFVRQVKGASSHFANHQLNLSASFNWQAEYGIVSFDAKLLDKVVEYVKGQQQHHLNETTIPIFEKLAHDEGTTRNQ